ncbi:F-box/LRR-repeat protein At3g03360-like [Nicotiana tabacum]|uniref:F-box/LRR-repeat protein 13-like n=2 Tax=Nicotiana TaxID=4085 RepID=A0A1S3Y1T9_TOBAC|nr:PREDICTED: F-box/LRR-repeat protein 13-like [Nicotiana sylvestris]XP_016445957.1 PREDICTED: F-box/LRR-repeat protein 13-like [Nicotiana tabacum]
MATATIEVLPDCLVHKIVSCLSFKEAAKMSILSKTWLQGWMTHQNLELKAQNFNVMKILDKIMERYRDSKIHIEKFEFLKAFSISGFVELFPLIDKWLDIALHNGVKDLAYIDVRSSLYPLPIFTILAAKSLRELVLWGCDLIGGSLSGGLANCYSLRKLSLCDVCLNDNMLQTLLTSCPLIVNFFIEHCTGLQKTELRNLQRVKSVSIKTLRKQCAKIQAPSLEHLLKNWILLSGRI